MNKVIFGGGFDPIHLGHINMARLASKHFDADVIFVPSPLSIWKEESAPIKDKVEMIKLSIQEYKRFSIDLFEVNSGKEQNYSIDTVRYFQEKYPHDQLLYLIGGDQVNEFHRWKEALELSKRAKIIFMSRPNIELNEENIKKYNMMMVPGRMVEVSASDIRSFHSLKLDERVIKYIEDNELYYIKKIKSYLKPKRYDHSKAVANLAYKIAKKHHLRNGDLYYISGFLHDIGKEHNSQDIMRKHYRRYLDMPNFSFHQFVGSYIAKTDFNIQNRSIIKAITFHATGNAKMDRMGKVIYAADKIDPNRNYDSKYMIDAIMKDIDDGFKLVLSENKKFLEENGKSINNRLTQSCFDYYLS
ncbi:MAG: nicotinate (nicotinamide) nucleotide adenylyltransferase [Bacilli bacterium]|jgi:nicotinate-nucleotide adenylyltransferase|nr:nicotinate (nicotinamide) nucleotide adenylyltransferase [Bacilli bacterium]MDD3841514.1 nicotinate (nicotinamide) nucleotide adenylyltransferase [Bacilli bacterium]HKM10512.1 nicotinate (nicotinamide) nucleotide adenylyltransferase [Bacilli bacterium]